MPKTSRHRDEHGRRSAPKSGARGYRLIGLDIGVDEGVAQLTQSRGARLRASDTTVDAEPSDIVIDRCYLHGNDQGDYRRGIALNGVRMAVVDSYLENFHDAHSDSQAIGGWNGAGPFRIVNNFLEAASENIMFGGADPAIDGTRAVRHRNSPQPEHQTAVVASVAASRPRMRSS